MSTVTDEILATGLPPKVEGVIALPSPVPSLQDDALILKRQLAELLAEKNEHPRLSEEESISLCF